MLRTISISCLASVFAGILVGLIMSKEFSLQANPTTTPKTYTMSEFGKMGFNFYEEEMPQGNWVCYPFARMSLLKMQKELALKNIYCKGNMLKDGKNAVMYCYENGTFIDIIYLLKEESDCRGSVESE